MALLPSHGKYVGASSVPFSEYRRKRGDRVGLHWRIPNTVGRRQVRHALIDTNYWKSFVHARLAVAMGDPGCLSLFGRDALRPASRGEGDANAGESPGADGFRDSRRCGSGTDHRLLADHLTAKYRVKTPARDSVGKIERGTLQPSPDLAGRIAETVGVEVDDLYTVGVPTGALSSAVRSVPHDRRWPEIGPSATLAQLVAGRTRSLSPPHGGRHARPRTLCLTSATCGSPSEQKTGAAHSQ